ncbi:aminoglycoside adenylyltransferase family protein [Billgrantia endophytica]|uniref:Aminoglycoside (3'') (9) adenylyltransferase n=1 Tax=Billgrantia endophytica TaxID=2033802 RepID=A0A2N7UED8_9GAMM|nr:aminoglycoside adenylyltransferase family protein [Halomonas endophytica]PMR78751.1 adenylyltransferase [Halomonas endophytica]
MTPPSHYPSESNTLPEEAIHALRAVRHFLDDSAIAAYLFGSAVMGGLRPDSDVDVLVIVEEGLTNEMRQQLVAALMTISGRVDIETSARPLELTIVRLTDITPWRYPPSAEFVYGEWLRQAFEAGHIPPPTHDPDLAIVLKKARDDSITLLGPDASRLLDPVPAEDIRRALAESLPSLLDDIEGDERNVVLTLARMWLTAATGDIAPKDIAARWAMDRLPSEQAALLDIARRGYLGECQDRWDGRTSELMALVTHMRQSIEACLSQENSQRPRHF